MIRLVLLLGILITGLGVVCLFVPQWLRRMLTFWETRKRIYLGGAIRLVLAAVLLTAAPQCASPTIITAIGILLLVSGLSLFLLGHGRLLTMLAWWKGQPLSMFRLVGLVTAGLGTLILYGA